MVYANRLCTARLIAPPPTISQMNSTSAISSGFAPAFFSALTCVVTPSAAIAIASKTVSSVTSISTIAFGSRWKELKTATTMNRIANHGMVILLFSLPPAGASCLTQERGQHHHAQHFGDDRRVFRFRVNGVTCRHHLRHFVHG